MATSTHDGQNFESKDATQRRKRFSRANEAEKFGPADRRGPHSAQLAVRTTPEDGSVPNRSTGGIGHLGKMTNGAASTLNNLARLCLTGEV
jgi:hypothetical protein